MISQNFLVLTLYSWDHTDHPTVRHDTWNGQIKGYRVLHVPFPLDYFPHTSPRPAPSRAAQLNTVIGDIRRSFDKVSPTYVDMMTDDHTLQCCPGTTTALNSLQPFTNYSIQVTFWDESTIRCVYIVCDSWAVRGGALFNFVGQSMSREIISPSPRFLPTPRLAMVSSPQQSLVLLILMVGICNTQSSSSSLTPTPRLGTGDVTKRD